jgi:squalene-hopene/tetraprenyl-beta-curcumene cyclase
LADFIKTSPDKLPAPKTADGVTYYPQANQSVWRAAGLAEWDRHMTGKLSESTDRALRDMLTRQSSHGGFLVTGEVEIPHVTTDFELSLKAMRAVVAAPGWLGNLRDESLLNRIENLKTFLRDSRPRNDYERVLRLELCAIMPELVSSKERDASMKLLREHQKTDGGWSTRSMSETRNWSDHVSDKVIQLIESQPDAADPASDPYMTALAIVLLRENGVLADDTGIQRGIAWLKREQRASGRWWMQSLYRGNYQFITYIATCQALKALALCGELEPVD